MTPADVLQPHLARTVRRVLAAYPDAADVILSLAAGDRQDWTLPDWLALCARLEKCNETVEYWLLENT